MIVIMISRFAERDMVHSNPAAWPEESRLGDLPASSTLSGNTRFTGPLLLLGWIRLGRFVLVLCLVIKARRSAALLPWNHLSELNSKNAPAWSFFACLLTNLKVIVRIVLHHCCNNTWQNYEGHLFPQFLCLPVLPMFSVVFCHCLCSFPSFFHEATLFCFSCFQGIPIVPRKAAAEVSK